MSDEECPGRRCETFAVSLLRQSNRASLQYPRRVGSYCDNQRLLQVDECEDSRLTVIGFDDLFPSFSEPIDGLRQSSGHLDPWPSEEGRSRLTPVWKISLEAASLSLRIVANTFPGIQQSSSLSMVGKLLQFPQMGSTPPTAQLWTTLLGFAGGAS